MRDRHEERALELLGFGELLDHAAEALRKKGDLVATLRLGDLNVVATGRDRLGRACEREHGLREPSREPPEKKDGEHDPGGQREQQAFDQADPLLPELCGRLGDDQPTERLRAADELHRLCCREQPAAVVRRGELERDETIPVEPHVAEVALL